MSHSRKDTLVKTLEWKKHLKPEGKRRQAKRERRAIQKLLKNIVDFPEDLD